MAGTMGRCALPSGIAARAGLRAGFRGNEQRRVVARMMMPDDMNIEDTPGIDALMDRDYKVVQLKEGAFLDDPNDSEPQQEKEEAQKSTRAQLRSDADTPRRSKDAIEAGLQLFQLQQYEQAIEMFQLALELPGSGFMRLAGSVKEVACASDGEEESALYNIACCYSKMGRPEAALTCLDALLDSGFDNLQALRQDPDLAAVRGPELEKLLAKRDGLFSKVFGGKKPASNRPWIQW